jgi:hypothetical protein
MPMWRCPHCGTPQAETARCWVCHRSSTACATCRHFRRSVAAQLGYCGLDRQRRPLSGDEIRGCWEATIAQPEVPEPVRGRPMPAAVDMDPGRTPVRRLEFVEVGASLDAEPEHRLRRRKPEHATRPASPVTTTADDGFAGATVAASSSDPASTLAQTVRLQPGSAEPRWSLWSDGEI